MSMNDDFGAPNERPGSDRSQTAEDATLRGTPIEESPGLGEASSEDPDIAGSGSSPEEARAKDPSRIGEDIARDVDTGTVE
ncbi:MAG TPA: hypothetical protein VGO65_07490 [Pseudolysinimonas sp.]|jgi:hypothetical protein|nr:hypothetical protein [Pseudolysinimonas sp.]